MHHSQQINILHSSFVSRLSNEKSCFNMSMYKYKCVLYLIVIVSYFNTPQCFKRGLTTPAIQTESKNTLTWIFFLNISYFTFTKKHLVNFIIMSFTKKNIDSNIIHPGKINDWNLKITYPWNLENSPSINPPPFLSSIQFIFQGVQCTPERSRSMFFFQVPKVTFPSTFWIKRPGRCWIDATSGWRDIGDGCYTQED